MPHIVNWFRFIAVIVALTGSLCLQAKKLALLIGISEYPQTGIVGASWKPIHGANDVALLAPTLRKQGFNVTQLTNHQGKAAAIRSALKGLASQAGQGDLVYIHFSGHGQPYEDLSGDEADGWDEAIIPYDAQRFYHKGYKGENHILDDELEVLINRVRLKAGTAGFVYVVLDACHIGGASRAESEADSCEVVRGTHVGFSPHGKKYIPKIDRRGHLKVKRSPKMAGICYLEACRAYQNNTEIKEGGRYYGSLSYYINQSLKAVTLSRNCQWTNTVVRKMARDKRLVTQNPVIETDR